MSTPGWMLSVTLPDGSLMKLKESIELDRKENASKRKLAEKPKKPAKRSKKLKYWAVNYVSEDGVFVTFIPHEHLEIDLNGDVKSQTKEQMEAMYEEYGEDEFPSYHLIDDARHIALVFEKNECITVAYTYDD